MTQDGKALQDLFERIHYSEELLEEHDEDDEVDPDDDEDYEPELTPEQKLGLMSDEEFEEFIDNYLKNKHRNEN